MYQILRADSMQDMHLDQVSTDKILNRVTLSEYTAKFKFLIIYRIRIHVV